MNRVLVVDDEPQIVRALVINLKARKYEVDAAGDGATALKLAAARHPDVIVLDLGLPDMDGTTVLKMLRGASQVPVVVATARDDESEIVAVLDAGADDYLVKPFSAAQLDARIRAVLRRGGPTDGTDTEVAVGGLRIDHRTRRAVLDGTVLELTPREFDLLHYLATRAGQVVTKRELLSEVWRVPYGGPTRPSTCTCPGCAASSARPRRSRATCTPSAGWVSG